MSLLQKIKSTKRDYSEYLYHFTRRRRKYDHTDILNSILVEDISAFSVLKEILESKKLKGKVGFAPEKCVCFSETPIDELIWLMSQSEWDHDARYSFYGLAVKKTWLYEKGGRPVIYQHGDEKSNLGASHLYRHNRFEPANNIDWSWEREWRVKTEALDLDSHQTIVVCATASEAKEIMINPLGGEDWLATSIELFRR